MKEKNQKEEKKMKTMKLWNWYIKILGAMLVTIHALLLSFDFLHSDAIILCGNGAG